MRAIHNVFTQVVLLGACLLVAAPSWADVGHIANVVGDVKVERGADRLSAAKNMVLKSGDVVATGVAGRVNWQMADDSVFAVPEGSRFRIDNFSEKSSKSGGKAIFTLIKGAFRTISGLIGKSSGDTYQVNTPVVTMGIRGTDYAALLKKGGTLKHPDGVYGRVYKGMIFMKNAAGSLDVPAGKTGFADELGHAPILVDNVDELFNDISLGTNIGLSFPGFFNVQLRIQTPTVTPPVVPPVEVPASPS